MQNAIEEVISQLQTGWVFDAHFVINQLIKNHSDVYIHFAGPDQTTAQMHGHISQIIDNLPNTKQLGDNSCSENIHASTCSKESGFAFKHVKLLLPDTKTDRSSYPLWIIFI